MLDAFVMPGSSSDETGRAGMDATIQTAWDRGAAQWPNLVVEPSSFARAVLRAIGDAVDPIAELAGLHVTDLYLAQACVDGVPGAIAAFDALCQGAIERCLISAGLAAHVVADVAQEVRSKLFVAAEGSSMKIATYAGHASLHSWVRIVATRTAMSHLRGNKQRPVDSQILEALPSPSEGPDAQHFRATYGQALKAAFETALGTLTPRQRNLLRHRFLDGLTMEAIGALYGVHKTTAFRWLESAQATLSKRTQHAFQQRTQATASEMERIVGILQSTIELSLPRLLA